MPIIITKFTPELDTDVTIGKLSYRIWPNFEQKNAQIQFTCVVCNNDPLRLLSGLSIYFPIKVIESSFQNISNTLRETARPTSAITKRVTNNNITFLEVYDGIPNVRIEDVLQTTITHICDFACNF